MTVGFTTSVQGTVRQIVFAPPLSQALTAQGRRALCDLFAGLSCDMPGPDLAAPDLSSALPSAPPLSGIVLRAGDRVFACGPDAGGPDDAVAPDLAYLCQTIADCPFPVTFVVEGLVAGGFAEVMLAAHHRIAPPQARIALGAAVLGLMSGAGGTQRLAALVGAGAALRLMRGGAAIAAPEALAIGLIDRVVDGDRAALHATALAGAAAGPRQSDPGLRDATGFLAAIAAARMQPLSAVDRALVDCTEAALLLPRATGLAFEAALARDLAATPQAAALCHIHRAERHVARLGMAGHIAHLGVIGADPALAGIIGLALARSAQVLLADADRGALMALLKTVAARQAAWVQAGRIGQDQADADWARLLPVQGAADMADCDMVICADAPPPPHNPAQTLLIAGRGAVPAGAYRLLMSGRVAELGLGPGADPAAVAQTLGRLRRLGLTAVPTDAACPRGVARRLLGAADAACVALADLGGDTLSRAMAPYGLAPPPLPLPPAQRPATRIMDEPQIANRILAAMANEGARLIDEGIASAQLIDLVAVHGLGFARAMGGPMHQADRRGLMILRRDLALWGGENPVWHPAPALDGFVSAGGGFGPRVTTG